jgi:hypothetical protein
MRGSRIYKNWWSIRGATSVPLRLTNFDAGFRDSRSPENSNKLGSTRGRPLGIVSIRSEVCETPIAADAGTVRWLVTGFTIPLLPWDREVKFALDTGVYYIYYRFFEMYDYRRRLKLRKSSDGHVSRCVIYSLEIGCGRINIKIAPNPLVQIARILGG